MSFGLLTLFPIVFSPHLTLRFNGLEEVINHFPSRKLTAFGSTTFFSTETEHNFAIPGRSFKKILITHKWPGFTG